MESLGRHLILEYYGCSEELLNDVEGLEALVLRATEATGATILHHYFHRYAPQGVSGAVVISESHTTIHTWPEFGYLAADVFTCGTEVDPWAFHRTLVAALGPGDCSTVELRRGLIDLPSSRIPTSYRP